MNYNFICFLYVVYISFIPAEFLGRAGPLGDQVAHLGQGGDGLVVRGSQGRGEIGVGVGIKRDNQFSFKR